MKSSHQYLICNFSIVGTIKKYFLIPLLLLIAACSKDSHAGDMTPPVITIMSPSNNQHFTAGDTISTVASATDNDQVTELHIHVINKATGELLRDIHSYPAKTTGTVQIPLLRTQALFIRYK